MYQPPTTFISLSACIRHPLRLSVIQRVSATHSVYQSLSVPLSATHSLSAIQHAIISHPLCLSDGQSFSVPLSATHSVYQTDSHSACHYQPPIPFIRRTVIQSAIISHPLCLSVIHRAISSHSLCLPVGPSPINTVSCWSYNSCLCLKIANLNRRLQHIYLSLVLSNGVSEYSGCGTKRVVNSSFFQAS